MSRPRSIPARRGFTLIEVILAMALTAIVLLIIATGIGVQLRAFDTSRARVERAQLARVLLHRMADDLRGLLPPGGTAEPAPTTETSTGEESSTREDTASETAADSMADETEEVDAGTEDSASESVPGVYGELDWLRIDVVQAVRRGTSSSEASGLSVASQPQAAREIETITYYVVAPQQSAAGALSADSEQAGGGLVRRQLVRPAAARAAELGLLEYRDPSIAPLANEVTAVEFRYHDGQDWVDSWDTSASGTLPSAIEIRLFLSPIPRRDESRGGSIGATSENPDELPDVQYRLIVPITIEGPSQSTGMGISEESPEEEGSSTESDSGDNADQPGGPS